MEHCTICIDEIGKNNYILLECNHKFHASCFVAEMYTSCPTCQFVIVNDSDNTNEEDNYSIPSPPPAPQTSPILSPELNLSIPMEIEDDLYI